MRLAIAFVAVLAASACTTHTASLSENYCERLDECNLLRNSVPECVDLLDTALKQMSDTVRGETELTAKQCLEHPSCDGFGTCVAELIVDGI